MRGLGAGMGLVFGAGLGILVAVLALETVPLWLGLTAGAALGLVVGATVDANSGPSDRTGPTRRNPPG